jgi:UTP:GlnB (protein PII) uridylyltransferase
MLFPQRRRLEKRDGGRPAALLALAMGRGELNPSSDVDVMFLHAAWPRIVPAMSGDGQQVLYLLWISIRVD